MKFDTDEQAAAQSASNSTAARRHAAIDEVSLGKSISFPKLRFDRQLYQFKRGNPKT
jgi:hypothetical protein